ncbi:Putative MFS transporter [Candidatus Fokinia solitaria]|uniref:Lysosomal dipeptide transporter MFSD1 n=1 Tax=Candidatus Fokinia solitaria TaxID=1802984 RepID=A0A2U8BT08_9RICK|nr:MFS transporter [Candidatus Fokinia solitaria]AWD33438.1 Putative MFS transporter [Candidatus Fokinia solitaria]
MTKNKNIIKILIGVFFTVFLGYRHIIRYSVGVLGTIIGRYIPIKYRSALSHNSKYLRILITVFLSCFYGYQYVIRILPAILINYFPARYHVSPHEFGLFASIYYIAYSTAHIPVGLALDRFGLRNVIFLSVFLLSSSLILCIVCDTWYAVIFSRVIAGIVSSAAILGCFKALSTMFSPQVFNFSLGIAVSIGLALAAIGNVLVNNMFLARGFDALFIHLSLIGLGLTLIIFLLIPNAKNFSLISYHHQKSDAKITFSAIWSIFKNKQIITLFLINGAMIGVMEGFMDAWGSTFLQEKIGISALEASYVATVILSGHAIGAPIIGYLSSRYIGCIPLIRYCGVALLTLLVFFATVSSDVLQYSILEIRSCYIALFIMGIATAYQIPLIAATIALADPKVSGLTGALCNMVGMAFGSLFHHTIPFINSLCDKKMEGALYTLLCGTIFGLLGTFYPKWTQKLTKISNH